MEACFFTHVTVALGFLDNGAMKALSDLRNSSSLLDDDDVLDTQPTLSPPSTPTKTDSNDSKRLKPALPVKRRNTKGVEVSSPVGSPKKELPSLPERRARRATTATLLVFNFIDILIVVVF